MVLGRYRGAVAEKYRDPEFLSQLEGLADLLDGPKCETISKGRNHNARLAMSCCGAPLAVAAKCFGRRGLLPDMIDARRGSKARRTWVAARALEEKGVGTPSPIGFLERWENGRLVESCYLAEYQEGVTDFHRELVRLFREDPICEKFIALMQCVADAVRAMHEAGFLHNDLGNQNVLLRRIADAQWGDVRFIDLNRGRLKRELTTFDRARDISRIYLPSDLLRVFREMYSGDTPPSREFVGAERFFRGLYAMHSKTRCLRHPVKWRHRRREAAARVTYPSEKDMWIWDERSAQAISTMRPRDKRRFYPVSRQLRIVRDTLAGLLQVKREYEALLAGCYRAPVEMAGRVGVGVSPMSDALDTQLLLLDELGKPPVLVRFHHHWSDGETSAAESAVAQLREGGHSVSLALVQDRRAVTDPKSWAGFVDRVLGSVGEHAEYVEVCHAINRVKWGIWDFGEHRRLLSAVAGMKEKYPGIRFTGPGVIDFEYPFLMAALRNVPEGLSFEALSHHLYVDRRGAPESTQGPFDALKKFALARAIARWAPCCGDRLIVSEVNWPLKGTGVWSPVTSPYESPGPRHGDPSVDEDEYGAYMVRYLATALCSGMVDRVYWWRLVARGFGLVDDTDPIRWRKRPAFKMLVRFLSLLGGARFVAKLTPSDGVHMLAFETDGGEQVYLAYSSAGVRDVEVPFEFSGVVDSFGGEQRIGVSERRVRLSGRPIYLRNARD